MKPTISKPAGLMFRRGKEFAMGRIVTLRSFQQYNDRGNAYKALGNVKAAYSDLKKAKQLGFRGN